jgi:hypothetical protein
MSEVEITNKEVELILAYFENDFSRIDTDLSGKLHATLKNVKDQTTKARSNQKLLMLK